MPKRLGKPKQLETERLGFERLEFKRFEFKRLGLRRLRYACAILLACSTGAFAHDRDIDDILSIIRNALEHRWHHSPKSDWTKSDWRRPSHTQSQAPRAEPSQTQSSPVEPSSAQPSEVKPSPAQPSQLQPSRIQQSCGDDLAGNAAAKRGRRPADRNPEQLSSDCKGPNYQASQKPSEPSAAFVVDGLTLYEKIAAEGDAYKQYQCLTGDRFSGLTWCHKETVDRNKRGEAILSWHSILHDQEGTTLYVSRYVNPVHSVSQEAYDEIERLSLQYGQPARELRMPPRPDLPRGLLLIWGKIELRELSAPEVSAVASAGSTDGLLVSYFGDLRYAAKMGAPIYRLAGGPGLLLAVIYGVGQDGEMRTLTADMSRISAPAPLNVARQDAVAPQRDATDTSAKQPAADRDFIRADTVQRGWLGIQSRDLIFGAEEGAARNLIEGAVITDVYGGGPAAKAGIQNGDVITAINGNSVHDASDLADKIANVAPQSEARVALLSAANEKDEKYLSVTVAAAPKKNAWPVTEFVRLIEAPGACATVRRAGPAEIRTASSSRETGPLCSLMTQCLRTMPVNLTKLLKYVSSRPLLAAELERQTTAWNSLQQRLQIAGNLERVVMDSGSCGNTYRQLNTYVFAVTAGGSSYSTAFDDFVAVANRFLLKLSGDYDADMARYAAWLPSANEYPQAEQFARLKERYDAAYQKDPEEVLRLRPEFVKALEAAERSVSKTAEQYK